MPIFKFGNQVAVDVNHRAVCLNAEQSRLVVVSGVILPKCVSAIEKRGKRPVRTVCRKDVADVERAVIQFSV